MTWILAIDPGTTESGFVFLRQELTGSGVVSSGVLGNDDILKMIVENSQSQNLSLSIEMIASYGMPVGREVFETCVWIGRFMQSWRSPESVRLVYRRDVKNHLCGSAKAKDANIWQALLDKYGGNDAAVGNKAKPGPLYGVKSHARAALAVAVTSIEVPCNL